MPDRVVHTSGDRKEKSKESLFPCRSAWMSHWIQGSCNTTVPASESHSNVAANDSEEDNCEITLRPLFPQTADSLPSKTEIYAGPGNISEKENPWNCQQGETFAASCALDSAKASRTRIAEDRLEIANDAMAVDSTNIRCEISGSDPFLRFKFNQRIDDNLDSKKGPAFSGKRASKSQIVDYYDCGTASLGASGPDSSPSFLRLGSTEAELPSKTYQQEHARLSRKIMRLSKHEESFGRKSLPVSMPCQDNFSRFKVPYGVAGDMPMQSRMKESNQSSLQAILRKHLIDAKFAYKDANDGRQSQRRAPTHSHHDMETLRICATVDSVEAVDGSTSKFSQTTHRLLITKRSDLSFLNDDEMFQKSKQSSNGKGSGSHELFMNPVDFGSHEFGRKLRVLGNSTELAGEVGKLDTDSLILKSDSSAETDIMDIDNFPAKDALMGIAAFPSTKGFKVDQKTGRTEATTLMLGDKSRGPLEKAKWHEFVQESPSHAVGESSMENRGASSSRTESMDAEHLFSHSELPDNLSASKQDTPVGETSNRWVKRLKLSASYSVIPGIESSRMRAEAFSTASTKNLGNTSHYDRNSASPVSIKPVDKGSLEMDENLVKERRREPLSAELGVKEFRNQTLSHPWIQRWCHNQAVTGKAKVSEAVICEPQSLESSLNEFQRKKLPSIAAMALMGKATNCFQPCEFRRKGPVVVWNSD